MHQDFSLADTDGIVVHLTERFEEYLEFYLSLPVILRSTASGINHYRGDTLFSDFFDLGSSPSYPTQGVTPSPAGGKGALEVSGIKEGNMLFILLTV